MLNRGGSSIYLALLLHLKVECLKWRCGFVYCSEILCKGVIFAQVIHLTNGGMIYVLWRNIWFRSVHNNLKCWIMIKYFVYCFFSLEYFPYLILQHGINSSLLLKLSPRQYFKKSHPAWFKISLENIMLFIT